jgi:hypothetical protein
MSNSDTNKYRIKAPQELRASTKGYPRIEAIKAIGKWLKIRNNLTVSIRTFDNKTIPDEHKETLMECARLWNKLTELENAIKGRTRKNTV